ncbi:hypothetical protein SAMN05216516_101359 [Izhakiella capsodis]|uniref:Uncharacterized protein n=1 Tax=Izhakiella capsodis TaxID=1367852 RepID=A0A1I4UUW7_9GAMM|nr:hypothetical protein SAMN05216516_101359 [Izhakiella capsodis]
MLGEDSNVTDLHLSLDFYRSLRPDVILLSTTTYDDV